jgi:hypothetical protein
MPDEARPRFPELTVGSLLLLSRLLVVPPGQVWRDWIAVLGAFGLYQSFSRRSDQNAGVLICVIAYLAAIHAVGTLPHVMSVWGVFS